MTLLLAHPNATWISLKPIGIPDNRLLTRRLQEPILGFALVLVAIAVVSMELALGYAIADKPSRHLLQYLNAFQLSISILVVALGTFSDSDCNIPAYALCVKAGKGSAKTHIPDPKVLLFRH